MSSEIKAMHVASFLRLSARYIDGARTGENSSGEVALVPVVPRNGARAAARPSAPAVRVIRLRQPQGYGAR